MRLSHFLKNNFRITTLKGIAYTVATFCMFVLMTGIGHAQLTSNNGWIYLRNQSLYGNNTDGLYFTSNKSTVTQLVMRDKEGTNYGRLYGNSDGEQFGLMDGDGNWSYVIILKSCDYVLMVQSELVLQPYQQVIYLQ